jgi:hypothetical protein
MIATVLNFVRTRAGAFAAIAAISLALAAEICAQEAAGVSPVGAQGAVGCGPNPKRVQRLVITEPGVYENILVDGEWGGSTLVKINADNVTLRNCEIRHGQHNAVTVYASNVTLESCKIHHVLAGSFSDQHDAHGITGRPTNLTIRNCDIGLTSGDSIQFDPGRGPWDQVLVENCNLWTGPLPADAAGFRRGERPGENAVDTKQQVSNPRSRLTIRNCLMYGWNQPGQISNLAALNLKNHVQATVENCVFRDNEICLRLRGGEGELGGALVIVERCAVYDSAVALRIEDQIRDLRIRQFGIAEDVGKKVVLAGKGAKPEFENVGEFKPAAFEEVVKRGVAPSE